MSEVDLDQLFTMAGAAMTFAAQPAIWPAFAAQLQLTLGRVPISRDLLAKQALRILLMVDPERLPS